MRKIILVAFLLFANLLQAQDIKIMTYNLRLDLASDGQNAWPKRKEMVVAQLQKSKPDFLGTQEGLPHQIEYILKVIPSYASVGVPRDDGKTKGEYSNVFYNKKKYKVLKENTIWLSRRPRRPSKGWDAAYPRICSYGLFEDLNTGKKLWVFNTHFDHKGDKARCKSVKLIKKTIKKVNKKKYPVVIMGDFNLEPDSKPIEAMSKQYVDTYWTNPPANSATFNGFEKLTGPRIDYIFVSKDIAIKNYAILVEQHEGLFPSDHFPVVAEISIGTQTITKTK